MYYSRMINKCTKWALDKSVVLSLPLRDILPLFQSLLSDAVLANAGKGNVYTQGRVIVPVLMCMGYRGHRNLPS